MSKLRLMRLYAIILCAQDIMSCIQDTYNNILKEYIINKKDISQEQTLKIVKLTSKNYPDKNHMSPPCLV